MNVAKTNQKGFSIIEVVLVLAIAGLIFLMVFVALPALQRSQRDSGRRNDVGVVVSAINSYASNNRGRLPANAGQISTYIPELSQYDMTTTPVPITVVTGTGGNPTLNQVRVHLNAQCNNAATATPGSVIAGTGRQAAVRVMLESSNNTIYCQNA